MRKLFILLAVFFAFCVTGCQPQPQQQAKCVIASSRFFYQAKYGFNFGTPLKRQDDFVCNTPNTKRKSN